MITRWPAIGLLLGAMITSAAPFDVEGGQDSTWTASQSNFTQEVNRRRDLILSAIKKDGSLKPWEGIFSTGNSFHISGWLISAKQGYASIGRLADMGKVEVHGNRLRLVSISRPFANGKSNVLDLDIVKWGERVYLIEPTRIIDFCNLVNSGAGISPSAPRRFFPRKNADAIIPPGTLPDVPKEYRGYILQKPLVATLITVSRKKRRVVLPGINGTAVGYIGEINIGTSQGLRVGMELFPLADVSSVITVYQTREESARVLVTSIAEEDRKSLIPGSKLSTLDLATEWR
jgi:hypothetical protein